MQKIRPETGSNNETRYAVHIVILSTRFFFIFFILLNNILVKKYIFYSTHEHA